MPVELTEPLLREVIAQCQTGLPGWRGLAISDFEFAPPKGFSSFTMVIKACDPAVSPPAILYRRLAGKENAILDTAAERAVFLGLSGASIAATCDTYTPDFRLEGFYPGRTLVPEDLLNREVLEGVGEQLAAFHTLRPTCLPSAGFFELLFDKWSPMARRVLVDQRHMFPESERGLCEPLMAILDPVNRDRALALLPDEPLTFCHNDTYHGNVMRLEDGQIRLLDFEFSCLNHRAFDFANLFAESVMVHGLSDPPYFRIAEPAYSDREIGWLVDAYLVKAYLVKAYQGGRASDGERERLVAQTRQLIPLSDYMYAMAALPLSVDPIQKIRFLVYASQRFARFLKATRLTEV
jgi:thiamine kinase-like enzyme